MAIQIGKYKRPGIFDEEYDNSVIQSQIVQGVNNLVIGVSKKGPINAPILLTTVDDLTAIFGTIDRTLERRGSYFHRTITQMLQSSPVWAMNLLATDDTLDQIEYKSCSTSTTANNDDTKLGAYRRFYNTTGFWKRDTSSFLDITENDAGDSTRLIHFTNMSDKFITVFAFKTQLSGYDDSLVDYYGSVSNLPDYVNQNDYASDYMIDVVVVSGDWSNYHALSIDARFNRYFDNSGLIKGQVSNFANDRNVTLLAYYEGLSLIPFFRDLNGKNRFIETVINRDTDKTGLFCAFNSDLLEGNYYSTGLIDLLGNNLAGSGGTYSGSNTSGPDSLTGLNNNTIDFLSYYDTIVESIEFDNTLLDRAGNTTAAGTASRNNIYGGVNRTGWYAEDFANGISLTATASGTGSVSVTYGAASDNYAVIGGNLIQNVATASFTINSSSYPFTGTGITYSSVFVLGSNGVISKNDNFVNSSNPQVQPTDIVLGYVSFNIVSGALSGAPVFTNVSVNNSGFVDMTFGTGSNDYFVTDLGNGSLNVVFNNTAAVPSVANYAQYRRIKFFNNLISLLNSTNSSKMTMVINNTTQEKASLAGMTVTNIVTSTTSNKSFTLNTGLQSSQLTDVINGLLLFYTVDDELILSQYFMETKTTQASISGTASGGVVAQYSKFYQDFKNGIISTGDYFYDNILTDPATIQFLNVSGNDYIVFYSPLSAVSLLPFQQIIVPSSVLNTGVFTIQQSVSASSIGFAGSGYYAYQVSQLSTAEVLTNVTTVYGNSTGGSNLLQYYLKIYSTNNGIYVRFTDSLLQSDQPINDLSNNQIIFVQSQESNFKETVEIVEPTGYTPVPNKVLINGSRYTNIKIGDFLEAYVDPTTLQVGEQPRNFTRVLSKKVYAADTTLVEVSCDAEINKVLVGSVKQTNRYTPIDDYVTTYKAIALKGFRIRNASLPDGTETTQNTILNLVANGTPLFKALTNKEAFDFRYLIDSFGLGLIENSKQQLMDIVGNRLDSFAFLNMPSMKAFKESSSPSFVDSDGVLQLEFVAEGGDPESNPAFLYSFGQGAGTTCAGYFMPYVTVDDNGRPTDMPPAMFAATTYMRKMNSNVTSITPWTIAAGVTNGRIVNISGVEMDFTADDLDFINQAQMNPIVFKRNRGYIIDTENTALTLYKSALSFIHVREVLIELERELSVMLLDFQWKFNTPEIRAEIKLRADTICERYVNKNGLFNYFNKIDEENNTPDIIDNQIGVLDTYVEPIKGMGIIVNNITILRTGAIASGGFLTV